MTSDGKSLRLMVEHWLVRDSSNGVRVLKFRHRPSEQERYVCIETLRGENSVAMFFFRHQDGTWRIYPPSRERPALRLS